MIIMGNEILENINDRLKYDKLNEVNDFIKPYIPSIIEFEKLFQYYPKEKLPSKGLNPSILTREIIRSFRNINAELCYRLNMIITNQNPYAFIELVEDEEDEEYGFNHCIEAHLEGMRFPVKITYITFEDSAAGLESYAHEAAHTLAPFRNDTTVFISEIESLFLAELVVLDLLNRNVITSEEYLFLRQRHYTSLKRRTSDLITSNKVLDEIKYPCSLSNLSSLLNKYQNTDEFNEILDSICTLATNQDKEYMPENFRYIVGEVVSNFLIKEYQIKPKKTMDKFMSFFRYQDKFNVDSATHFLTSLTFKEALESYIEDMKKEENLLLRNIKKR